MYERIGTCGSCGGDVLSYTGPWAGIGPPPSPACAECKRTVALGPVLPMREARRPSPSVAESIGAIMYKPGMH